jgi:hypothetical protein
MDQIPITTHQAKFAQWIALILSIIDLGLSLVNIGLTSFFVGMIAAASTIIHISTHLIIIRIREKRAFQAAANTLRPRVSSAFLPPTSNLGSILVTLGLAMFYLAAFGISVWGVTTRELYNLVTAVVYLDAAFELLCAGALTWLLYVGIKERERYLETSKKIRLKDIPNNTIMAH